MVRLKWLMSTLEGVSAVYHDKLGSAWQKFDATQITILLMLHHSLRNFVWCALLVHLTFQETLEKLKSTIITPTKHTTDRLSCSDASLSGPGKVREIISVILLLFSFVSVALEEYSVQGQTKCQLSLYLVLSCLFLFYSMCRIGTAIYPKVVLS